MQCIVFTDSQRLAEKYKTSQQDVLSLLNKNLMVQQVVEFLLLDTVDYQEELGVSPSWENYKEVLSDFMMGMGLQPSPTLSLFIIGGDDVIPMPRILSPITETEDLQADMLYCFAENEPTRIEAKYAQCNVGRLPLEDGILSTSLRDDLQSYFNLSNMMLISGIDVDKVLMTSTQSWLPASNDMVRGLPVEEPRYISDATKGNMYMSPRLSLEDDYVIKQYQNDIGHADMLMFNLHGSDMPGYSSFFGEGAQGHNTPEAFSIDMLRHSGARIFNTVACFGGRYIGYDRDDSMLLSSLYGGGVMLYAGSCTSALGRSGQIHHAAQDALMPSGFSESFMKLYSLYLFQGMSAGLAFLQAKCDYFNLCRSLDGDDFAMGTILMFNLYGMPVLNVNKQEDVIQEARGVKEVHQFNWRKTAEQKTLYSRTSSEGLDILAEVRSRVDSNLQKIRTVIESNLYRYWGLNPSDLQNIYEVSDGTRKSYKFEYITKNAIFSKRSWAIADYSGNVKDVVHFK